MVFKKTYRQHIGADVQTLIHNLMHNQYSWKEINRTDLVLIPKCKYPVHPKDFRPISLCNAIYKVAAKIYSNRITLVLPTLISENQSGFVNGRLVTDAATIRIDAMFYIKASLYNMALKLDMAKAFDRINWAYLEFILHKFQFPFLLL